MNPESETHISAEFSGRMVSTRRGETKVVYLDNGRERVLRGNLVGEDADFIYLERRDGKVRLAKQIVLRIESWIADRHGIE